jgi:hypothetical protein
MEPEATAEYFDDDFDESLPIREEWEERLYRFLACPQAAPSPAQFGILAGAVARACAAGLRLPPFRVAWVAAPLDGPRGATTRHGDRSITVTLNANLWSDEDLARTVIHEMVHVADYGAGRALSRDDMEERADRFAAAMILTGVAG